MPNIYSYNYKSISLPLPVNTVLGKTLKSANEPNCVINNYLKSKKALAVYTDGSKSDGTKYTGVACQCHDLNINISIAIDKTASVYTAHCVAIFKALDIALENFSYNYVIFSDSLSLQATNLKTNILEIKRKYNAYTSHNPDRFIQFIWVPSHMGIIGNEKADELAKLGKPLQSLSITRVGIIDNAQYQCGNENQDLNHIL
ncbi:hypothetical protein TSAR_015103 [Trichomalopsis sarcophagae]|uniref:RNase H type-1 domain-containing protein n=1 Tax=Trichomalopsis sarcophagae TaxID=543379 RepID=A0A232ENR2_9HYME|nr:hypothetical protein TSAR_015103 [Trichomalopsis sarcophagae]